MNKVHLFSKRCGVRGIAIRCECGCVCSEWEVEYYETIDTTKVTCLTCQKTQAFKDLERTNNETKKVLEELNEIKHEAIEAFKESEPVKQNKYKRDCKGVDIDVYDVLKAFDVTNPAIAHAIKKLLAGGKRGYKDVEQDYNEAIESIERGKELI